MTTENRKTPSGAWLGYPVLHLEDIEQESFKYAKYAAQSLVEDRKGRIYLLIKQESYQRFLKAVRRKFGDISASTVEKAAQQAVEGWIKGVESE